MEMRFILKSFITLAFYALLVMNGPRSVEGSNIVEQLKNMAKSGNLSNDQLCKLKSDLMKLYTIESEMNNSQNQIDIQSAIDFVLERLKNVAGTCTTNENNSTDMIEKEDLDSNPKDDTVIVDEKEELLDDPINGPKIGDMNVGQNCEEDVNFQIGEIPNLKSMDCEAVTMEDYAESSDEEVDERKICDDCQMDYDNEETVGFNEGIKEAETISERSSKKLGLMLAGIGIGLIFTIASLSVGIYYGIEHCKSKENSTCSDNRSLCSQEQGQASQISKIPNCKFQTSRA